MRSISDAFLPGATCQKHCDDGHVCEDHWDEPMGHCGAAGMPCNDPACGHSAEVLASRRQASSSVDDLSDERDRYRAALEDIKSVCDERIAGGTSWDYVAISNFVRRTLATATASAPQRSRASTALTERSERGSDA